MTIRLEHFLIGSDMLLLLWDLHMNHGGVGVRGC